MVSTKGLVDTLAVEVAGMGRRRRRWTAEDKRRIVEEARAPGASVSLVARRHDLNANLLFKWRREAEAGGRGGALTSAELPDFVPIGVVGRASDGGPALLAGMPGGEAPTSAREAAERRRSAGLAGRPGLIEIELADGACVRVDAFVDTRALSRVLGVLKRQP
jgi:transposase